MKLKISEHELMKLIKEYLERKGFFVLRLNSGMIQTAKRGMVRLSPPGTPDLYCLKKGKSVFIEVKIKGNKLSQYQSLMLDNLEKHGAQTIVAFSLDDVIGSI